MYMEKIASFTVDHNKLDRGIYTSRVDGDCYTFDLRMKKPNTGDVLATDAMHAIEHIGATWLRSSRFKDQIIYFGPMGCRTGFYFLVSGMEHQDVIALIQDIFRRISVFSEPVPGAACSAECGNYLEHDLPGAREWAAAFVPVIAAWTPEKLRYEE